MPQVPKKITEDIAPQVTGLGSPRGGIPDVTGQAASRKGFSINQSLADSALDLNRRNEEERINLVQEAKQKMDTIVATDASNKLAIRTNAIYEQILQMKGAKAAEAFEYGKSEYRKAFDEIGRDLRNESQKLMFQADADNRFVAFGGKVGEYVGMELDAHAQSVIEASMAIATDTMAKNYDDPLIVSTQKEMLIKSSYDYAGMQGLNDDQTKNLAYDKISNANLKMIEMMLADGQLDMAEGYLKESDKTDSLNQNDMLLAKNKIGEYKSQKPGLVDTKTKAWYSAALNGSMTFDDVDTLLKSDPDMTIGLYEKLVGVIRQPPIRVNAVGQSDVARSFAVRFNDMDGEVDPKTFRIKERADDADLATIVKFRSDLMEAVIQGKINRTLADKFMLATEQVYDDATLVKKRIFKNYENSLYDKRIRAMSARKAVEYGGDYDDYVEFVEKGFKEIMSQPVSVRDARKAKTRLLREKAIKDNPEEADYEIGKVYDKFGIQFFCYGFDENTGKALLIPAKGTEKLQVE